MLAQASNAFSPMDLSPSGSFQSALETGKIERVIADALHARQLQHAALIGVVECVAADRLQRGGKRTRPSVSQL